MKSTHWFILPLQDKSEQSELHIEADSEIFIQSDTDPKLKNWTQQINEDQIKKEIL
jgi:hypothetical protein